jgi:CheY-like chemotaxis protein
MAPELGQHRNNGHSMRILMAEDDPDDRMLTRDALDETSLSTDLEFVCDGEELLDYLHRRGPYAAPDRAPRPGLILLDLNMPRKDGRLALKEIKDDPELRQIPIVVLTTSRSEEDVLYTYDMGVNSFIVKPSSFDSLVDIVRTLVNYWFNVVELPHNTEVH